MKNVLIELPEEVTAKIKTKAHDQVAEFSESIKGINLNEQVKKFKDELFREKCNYQSAVYFKDKRIEELTRIIQDKSAPKK